MPMISGGSVPAGREALSSFITSSLSAICFTCFGETKLTASMCRKPAHRCSELRRSEEHTSELQSRSDLVCRLLLEKKKRNIATPQSTTTRPRLTLEYT